MPGRLSQSQAFTSTEQEIKKEEIVLREISNSLEDTPENLMRRQRRNPFAVKVQARRLSEDLKEETEPGDQQDIKDSQASQDDKDITGTTDSQESPLVISSSQLSLYSLDGESLTFSSQSPCSSQPLITSPEPEPEPEPESRASQLPPTSGSIPRLGLSRSSRGSVSSSRGRPETVKKTSSLGSAGQAPRLGLSRGGGQQRTLLQMFAKTTVKAQLGPNR